MLVLGAFVPAEVLERLLAAEVPVVADFGGVDLVVVLVVLELFCAGLLVLRRFVGDEACSVSTELSGAGVEVEFTMVASSTKRFAKNEARRVARSFLDPCWEDLWGSTLLFARMLDARRESVAGSIGNGHNITTSSTTYNSKSIVVFVFDLKKGS